MPGFKVEAVGTADGPTLAAAFMQVVDQAKADVMLSIDEVKHAIASEECNQMLLARKAARDAINPRPGTSCSSGPARTERWSAS